MNKKIVYNLLYIFLILAVILSLIFIVMWLQSIGGQCVNDPIQFYANKTNAICNCFVAP